MEDNKEKKIEEVNNQVNEENGENLALSNDEKVTIEEETVVENAADIDDKSLKEESKKEATIPSLEEKTNNSKKLLIKEDSKVLFVVGIILVIIGTLLEIGIYVYENINKEIPLSNEEIMKQIGVDAEQYLVQDTDNNATNEMLLEYLLSKYNFECEYFEFYWNDTVYFNKCSINGSGAIYTYGTQLTATEPFKFDLSFVPASSQMYEGYTKMKITTPEKYSPEFDIDEYDNHLESFALIDNPNYNAGDDASNRFIDVSASLEILNGYVYINILDEKIKIEGISNAKQVIASDKRIGYSAGEWELIVLTSDNKIYMLNSEQFIDEYCDEDGECVSYDSFESDEALIRKVKQIRMNEIPTNNDYDEIKLATEGMNIFWLGITSDNEYYVFDILNQKELLLSEYIPYAFAGECAFDICIDYVVDLSGNVKNDNVDYKIKAKTVFASYEINETDEKCDFVLDINDRLNMICSDKEYDAESISVKDAKVSSIYYKEIKVDDDLYYNIIFVFEDNTALEVKVGNFKIF